jgi:hypothetical protein
MSIWSILRQEPTRVFAEWMASQSFNESIQTETFLSNANGDEIIKAMQSIQKFKFSIEYVEKVPSKRKYTYYGLLGETAFEITDKPSSSYLVNKWLVVSIANESLSDYLFVRSSNKKNVHKLVSNEDLEIRIVVDKQPVISFPDIQIRNKLSNAIQEFNLKKLAQLNKVHEINSAFMLIALIGSAVSFFFTPEKCSKVVISSLFIICIASIMKIIVNMRKVQYNILKESNIKLTSLGGWVWLLSLYAVKYPVLVSKYPVLEKFLTPMKLEELKQKKSTSCKMETLSTLRASLKRFTTLSFDKKRW